MHGASREEVPGGKCTGVSKEEGAGIITKHRRVNSVYKGKQEAHCYGPDLVQHERVNGIYYGQYHGKCQPQAAEI